MKERMKRIRSRKNIFRESRPGRKVIRQTLSATAQSALVIKRLTGLFASREEPRRRGKFWGAKKRFMQNFPFLGGTFGPGSRADEDAALNYR